MISAKHFAKGLVPQTRTSGRLSNACTAQNKLTDALRSYYGFASFRPGQLEALLPVAHGRDTFIRMPTGGGKTLCMFLVPLSISHGQYYQAFGRFDIAAGMYIFVDFIFILVFLVV